MPPNPFPYNFMTFGKLQKHFPQIFVDNLLLPVVQPVVFEP
jgi:hypothetical protein